MSPGGRAGSERTFPELAVAGVREQFPPELDATLLACAHATVKLHAEGNRAWWRCERCGIPFAPVVAEPVDATPTPEYVSVRELAGRIPYSEGAIRNMMSRGVFRLGVHYDKPNGGRPVFRWSAVEAWLKTSKRRPA